MSKDKILLEAMVAMDIAVALVEKDETLLHRYEATHLGGPWSDEYKAGWQAGIRHATKVVRKARKEMNEALEKVS